MLDFPRWKIWAVSLTVIIGVLFSFPSFLPENILAHLPASLRPQINLGLDLSGGSHILLEADTQDVEKQRLENMEETVRTEMRRGDPKIAIGDISRRGGKLSFMVREGAQVDAAVERVRALTQGAGMTGQRDWNVEVVDSSTIVLTPTSSGLDAAIESAMDVATEVIRKRIDEMGTKEPTIIRQGSNRIVVQVPGLQDPEALKSLLGKTAKLEFKLVDITADPAELAAGRAPVGSQILPYPTDPSGVPYIAVKRQVMISGDQLIDAQQGYDQQNNQPVVNIRFDGAGGRKFARVTTENVNKPFAIILDGTVLSAPNINEPILGGSAQISGSFTVASANELSIALRSGKLPVALTVVEERTVGPDLGADSIQKGMLACLIATTAVLVFMLVTYGRFGLYANIALVVNIFLIIGIMAIFNATLTLPGIAGFVLTIGAAVDANVLINERIREEQRRGRGIVQTIEVGYKEASRAIFDANITNVIAAALMFYFGSGPIRGFAVVLTIGIVTSVFTAVTVSRLLVSFWLRERPTKLTI
ncbi:protein translocase subunit SecD [Rhizorhapis suberifaciens]|uniref:Protein translocase subunit SecD n=1 Tax=Rhizorhapis suberifaciens TaxID=13656 RepID=A0A840HXW9_9SPHN|nr:protein translocase subunit SecD [Rhizorhapis suberifaciens]MBB4642409.1 preprotein translocase subunit SecD [Rhizorhapis suberifaciens]